LRKRKKEKKVAKVVKRKTMSDHSAVSGDFHLQQLQGEEEALSIVNHEKHCLYFP